MLCSYLLFNQQNLALSSNSVLELGSGVGLPGLLLGELKRRSSTEALGDVFLSDCDSSVLENLEFSTERQFSSGEDSRNLFRPDNPFFRIHVVHLNWLELGMFAESLSTEEFTSEMETAISTAAIVSTCQLIIGSALCYTLDHAALADTLK